MPLFGQSRMCGRQTIIMTTSLSRTIWATISVGSIIDSLSPFVPKRTSPPHKLSRFGEHITRKQWRVFCGMPLFTDFGENTLQRPAPPTSNRIFASSLKNPTFPTTPTFIAKPPYHFIGPIGHFIGQHSILRVVPFFCHIRMSHINHFHNTI